MCGCRCVLWCVVEYACIVFNLHLISDLELLNQGACKALNKGIS